MTTVETQGSDLDAPYLNSLADFSSLPLPGYVTLGEVNGHFEVVDFRSYSKSGNGNGFDNLFERFIENYNSVSKEVFSQTQARKIPLIKTTAKESFLLDTTEDGLKGIWNAWMENGMAGTLAALEKKGVPSLVISITRGIIASTNKVINSKQTVKTLLFPHLKVRQPQFPIMSNVEMIDAYAPIRNWSTSWVRAMSWHPRLPHLAVASHDDSVKIFINENPPTVLPVLKAQEQKLVSCIAWHPYVTEFTLGVETGFIVWTLHPPTNSVFPTSNFIPTTGTGHAPVTSVDYSHNVLATLAKIAFQGQKMVTTSSADSSIFIWSLSTGIKCPLYRLSSGGVPRAAWSPNPTTQIFANTPGKDFRLWEYNNSVVKPKTWRTVESPVEAFSWHPTGNFLFFVSNSILFKLGMGFSGEYAIRPVFDLGEVQVSQKQTGRDVRMGGKVLQIEWDPTGKRLAVLFSECSSIAILGNPPGGEDTHRLVPCDFICGEEQEYPVAIAFQKDFAHGSLLTIAWSSERLQYFPFIFHNPHQNQPLAMNRDCRTFSNPKASEGGAATVGENVDLPYFRSSPANWELGGSGDH